jgi:uncharacterized protein with von Willebrand factor type A (vWA) domain
MLQALVSSPALAASALDTLRLEWFQVDLVRDLVDHFLAYVEEAGAFAIKDFAARLTQEQQEALGALRLSEGMDPAMELRHFQDLSRALELRWLQKQAHRTAREKDMEKHLEFKKRIRDLQSKGKGGPA